MKFSGDIGLWQRRISECREGISRRQSVIDALQVTDGDRILDIGCGGGHLAYSLATGEKAIESITAIDVNSEQLAVAQKLCSGLASVEIIQVDATDMAFPNDSFDKIASIQTLEYIDDVSSLISEIRRILRPGGRVVLVSVLWDHWRFHGAEPSLNDRIIEAFRAHCAHQMLPLAYPEMLIAHGFSDIQRESVAFFNGSMDEQDYACWAAKVAAFFAVGQGVSEEDANNWLAQLADSERSGRFGFVSVPVLTTGIAG